MPKVAKGTGNCLCGSIHFTANNINNNVGACHCSMCRKWVGGPLMFVNCGEDVSFEGEDNISVLNSSDWAERGFCQKCGSPLFYRLKQGKQYMIPAGLFDDQELFVFDRQLFIDKKPSFYSFADKTKNMTEAEVIEKFG